jgi:hypothetical protein
MSALDTVPAANRPARVEGQARAWRVGIDGGTIREFLDETVAVGFFLACLRKIAGLES